MSMLDRLMDNEEPRIPAHQFYAALVAFADGQLTRAQVEALFNISDTGTDASEMDFLINRYQAAPNKERYLIALESVIMLLEWPGYDPAKQDVQDWLTAASS